MNEKGIIDSLDVSLGSKWNRIRIDKWREIDGTLTLDVRKMKYLGEKFRYTSHGIRLKSVNWCKLLPILIEMSKDVNNCKE